MNKTANKIQKLLLHPTRLSCKEIGERLGMSRQNVVNYIKRYKLKAPHLKVSHYPQGKIDRKKRKEHNVITGL